MANNFNGHFHVGYDEVSGMFKAYVYVSSRSTWSPTEVSQSLDDLLQKCRQQGLVHFDGLDQTAIDYIHQWLSVERPTLEHVESLWKGLGTPSKLGPRCPIGFIHQSKEKADEPSA